MTVKIYDSGLTLIVERVQSLRSVTSGIMVGAGSAYETPETNGISHFIEHMQYKGTKKRTAGEIVSQFDGMGAVYNAFTGKEYTCFYYKAIDENAEQCFDILSDLFLHSVYRHGELDRERKVIIEEINMSCDEPDGVCYDMLYKTAFCDNAVGMSILGTKENVSRFCKADIEAYKLRNYLPSNTVVAFVGNIDEDKAAALVEKYMTEFVGAVYTPPRTMMPAVYSGGYGEYIHDYEQSEISIAYPSVAMGDDSAATLSALDCILGNGMSSRLFQRLREQLGLVYSVYTSPWLGRNNGLFSVCANVNVSNIEGAVQAISDEINRLVRDGVTAEETEKAKMQLKVTAMFGKENPMNYMLALMRRRILLGRDYDLDELLELIAAITADDINAIARRVFSAPAAIAYAGKKPPTSIDKIYMQRR